MLIAVIIPFRGDPAILQWALDGFNQQILRPGDSLEVRICGDGNPVPSTPTPSSPNIRFHCLTSSRVGISQAKNLLLQDHTAAQPDIVIFANADTRPIPTFVTAHATRLVSLPPNHMVLGSSPFEPAPNPTIFDTLLAQTPMIFFYNQLTPHHLYDFRHAWNFNVSARFADLARIGFFTDAFRPYGYEDLDLAYRLMGPTIPAIYYDPAAQILHRHPMTLGDYLNREELLGIMAPVLHKHCPQAFATLYGPAHLDQLAADYRTFTRLDHASHRWIYHRLAEWATLPASALPTGDPQDRTLMTIYQMHIPLKRLAFRLGFLRGLDLLDDSLWQNRKPQSLWRPIVSPVTP